MEEHREFHGFAVVIDQHGTVQQVIRNDLFPANQIQPGDLLASLIETGSLPKYLTFLNTLEKEHALYDWDINVDHNGKVETLYFVGGKIDEENLIVASDSKRQADYYYQEIISMTNEQTDTLRGYSEDAGHTERRLSETDRGILDELSRLNNELSNLQRDLYKKNSQLEKLVKTRDKYLGMAAHDLRNPLGALSNMCVILLDEDTGPLNDTQRELIELVQETADHMLTLVEDMLDISKIETGNLRLNFEKPDIIQLVNRSVSLNYHLSRKKNITIITEYPPEPVMVRADSKKILQVLDNLISNAIKFSNAGSEVRVEVESSDSHVEVSIIDQGKGIPEKEMKQLFSPFPKISVTSTGGEKSTGLGLAICKKIIEGHNGRIGAESEEGKGSRFYFTLPKE